MKKLFFALISILSISSVRAGLGETLDQCVARYGFRTGNSAADQITFVRDHITITVHFRGDRSIQEDFTPEHGSTISEAQGVEILRENSEGSAWEISGETPVATTYIRKDGRATAQKAKPNIIGDPGGNVKLTFTGAELIIKYTAAAAANR